MALLIFIGNILEGNTDVLIMLTVHVEPSSLKPKYQAMSNKLMPILTPNATFNVSTGVELKQQVLQSETYRRILDNVLCSSIVLQALTEGDIEGILRSILDASIIKDELVRTVCQISSGNPFWITNIAEFIKEKGSVAFQDAILAKDSNNPLRSLILCRLDGLSTQVKNVAKLASCINEEFTEEFLHLLLPGTRDLPEALNTLCNNGFIEITTSNPIHYDFQNPLLRLVTYGLIPAINTSENHQKIAKLIEDTNASNLSPYYGRLV
jgi:predicted ATPase